MNRKQTIPMLNEYKIPENATQSISANENRL
jgi:hypothetical protein